MEATHASDTDDAAPAPTPKRLWWALVVVNIGVSLIIIDGTVVAVALPQMIRDLGLNLADAQWVTAIYTLIFAAILIPVGRLGDLKGRRLMFVIGICTFMFGSILAGYAQGPGSLIGARVIQGIGGGMMLPSSLSIVNASFRGRARTIAFAVWGSVIGGMAAVGPLLGGWLTTNYSWRWAFYINIPLGLAVLVGTFVLVPESKEPNREGGFDPTGSVLSALGLAFVVFGLIEGESYGWITPTKPFSLGPITWPTSAPLSPAFVSILLGLGLLVGFVVVERKRAAGGKLVLVDMRLFSYRSFAVGNIAALLVMAGENGILFVVPLFLQNVLGYSALHAGVVIMALAIGAFLSGGVAAELTRVMGARSVVLIGMALEIVGAMAMAFVLTPTTSDWLIMPTFAVFGLGLGLDSAQLVSITLSQVPTAQSGQASGVQSTCRELGSSLGIAVFGTLFSVMIASFVGTGLAGVNGLAKDQADKATTIVQQTAGAALGELRAKEAGLPPDQAALAHDVATVTESGLATATRITIAGAASVYVLGFLVALRLPKTPPPPRRTKDDDSLPDGDSDGDSDGDGEDEGDGGSPPRDDVPVPTA